MRRDEEDAIERERERGREKEELALRVKLRLGWFCGASEEGATEASLASFL